MKDILFSSAPSSVERPNPSRTQALLAVRVGPGGEQREIAGAIAALCSEFDDALAPVVGPHGVAALYKRSLYLTAQSHSELGGLHESVETLMDVSDLRVRLEALNPDQAAAAGVALLETFQALLVSLVGSSLTERLLSSLWDRPLSDPPALEPTA